MSQKLSNLATGSKIEFMSLWGAKIVWRVIGKNLTGMPSNSTTLLTDKIIAVLPFDANETSNSDSNRKSYGNNDYTVSNIRQWLNSTASAGNWYSAQHSADQSPDKSHVYSGYNSYDTWAGFLNGATTNERNALLSTTRTIGGRSGNGTTCTDKVFLLTTNEYGLETIANNGTKIPYFIDNNSRITQSTPQCVEHSNYPNCPSSAGANWYYWTATSYPSNSYDVRNVSNDGTLGNNYADDGDGGVRPACNLSSDILISDSTNADGNYTIIYNQPPTAPGTITVPEKITAGKSFEITWSAGSDPEGSLTGYNLQRKTNTQSWGQVYTGSARSYTDTIAKGTLNVQYRVQSVDSGKLTSAWTTSEQRDVNNNTPPVVSLNEPEPKTVTTEPPKATYTVTDEDGGTVTVKEYVDGKQTKSHTPELGQSQTIQMDSSNWINVLNGTHTYKVEAEDDQGESSSKEVTWTKDVDTIVFKLAEPLVADERPNVAVLTYSGNIPDGASIRIEICNNGNDEEPAWVDATQNAKNGTKVFMPNETKTAASWGVDIRVTINRNEAADPCYITSINGNFA